MMHDFCIRSLLGVCSFWALSIEFPTFTGRSFSLSKDVVQSRTEQPILSEIIRRQRLSFLGHLCRADTSHDHSRALQACIQGPSKDWRRRTGRSTQTWLRTVEDDLRLLISAWRRQSSALWIDRHGVNSCRRPGLRDILRGEHRCRWL